MSLSACFGPTGYPAFDEEQAEDDLIPAEFVDLHPSIALDTTRYAGSYDGIDYYIANGVPTNGQQYCVLAVGEGANTSGCSTGGTLTLTGPDLDAADGSNRFEVQLMTAPAISIDDWISLSDNVRVRATSSGGDSNETSVGDSD